MIGNKIGEIDARLSVIECAKRAHLKRLDRFFFETFVGRNGYGTRVDFLEKKAIVSKTKEMSNNT